MNEEIILTKRKSDVQVYKETDDEKEKLIIYTLDKVFEVLDDNDKISIVLGNAS